MRSMVTSVPILLCMAACGRAQPPQDADWPVYGRDPGGTRFSPLTQIHRGNVATLEVAWTYRTGETDPRFATRSETSFEATPIVVEGVLYLATPLGRVIALDPTTGAERWVFDPALDREVTYGDFTNRGVATWLDSAAAPGTPCRRRIYLATIDGRLMALDGATGVLCRTFGQDGTVELKASLRVPPFEAAAYQVTSPPVVINGLVITGSAIADNSRLAPASGEVQAFDARTGSPRWRWDPIPQDSGDPAFDTWRDQSSRTTGSANVWSIMTADPARDLIVAPTSSPAPDYYGGLRLGMNRYANSVVALRASSGRVAWDFQTVHHDLWDYDNAAPPVLATITRDDRAIPVVLQATKSGMLFVLDRETGQPVFPVEERPVPASTVTGEEAWPTQPFTVGMEPLSPHHMAPEQAWGVTPEERAACRRRIETLRNEGVFTPPSLEGSLVLPSNIGGAHWGGLAFEPVRHIAVVPVNRIPAVVQLIPASRLTEEQADREEQRTGMEYTHMTGTPFLMRRGFLLSPGGLPCSPPPWGSLVAVSLRTGQRLWEVPLGAMPNPAGQPAAQPEWGSPNLGGPIVTAGGVVFIGATLDRKIRAFDLENGRVLWAADLPAGGKATPATYAVGGRQYLVIAAGGGDRFGAGDHVVAFSLPTN
ncbi:MAG TPA: pyrroloquinoline quinone-dependent dehydrogenase [Gemmatimonadales bacterium]|nr:pyrroloquinoline quinone-dependent dehydrogenase [Gemmatimonadales bacterium]